jgi:hypothetical protein
MQDSDFLLQALKQAFLHPIAYSVNGVSMTDYTGLTDCLRFCDDRHALLLPCSISLDNLKKYSSASSRAVNRRHNPRLYEEYEIYKHDLSENIVIPNNFAPAEQAKEILELVEVSRQAAQKKKITATLFPVELSAKYKKLNEQYANAVQQAENILLNNPLACDVSLINDFAALYKKTISAFNVSNLILWINKKRFRYYLNEAAQLLKSHQIISVDFYKDHPFHGENYEIARYKVMQCKNNLKQLLFLLQKMAHDNALLTTAQAVIANREDFNLMIAEYRRHGKCDNLSSISAVRHNMQDLFNRYAFLMYLNGVRYAFENKYLNEYTQQRHPPLPTVSPQDEIKKIAKIVEESRKIHAESGKLKQICLQAFKDYEESYRKLVSSMNKVS